MIVPARIAAHGEVAREVVRAARNDRITFLAASLAFYAILSIFPLFLLVLVLGSILGGEAFVWGMMDVLEDVLTPETSGFVLDALHEGTGRGGAGVVSVVFLVWSSLRVFRGLDIAFSMVYGRGRDPTFLSSLINAFIVLVAMGVGFAAMFLVRIVVRHYSPSPLIGVFSPLLVFLSLAVVFTPMYVVFPGTRQPLAAVLPGTLFAALGWTLLAELFGIYAAHAGTYALFGLLGGLLLMFVWLYLGAVLLLLGAVINAVHAGRYREPVEHPTPKRAETPIGPGRDGSPERDA